MHFRPRCAVWVVVFIHLRMETSLRGRSGGHIGTAPTVSFGWIACMVLFVGKTVHMNQHHRCCTFVSPGLPTIGGYPGEQGVRDATPLGVVLSFFVLSNAPHVTIRDIAS